MVLPGTATTADVVANPKESQPHDEAGLVFGFHRPQAAIETTV